MDSLLTIDLVCLNERAVEVLLNIVESNDVVVDVFADLKEAMEAVMSRRSYAMLTEAEIAVYTEQIPLILPQLPMIDARTEEFAPKQTTHPLRLFSLPQPDFTSNHFLQLNPKPNSPIDT